MVEQDKDGDYDAGDQGNAPHLKEMMKMGLKKKTNNWNLDQKRKS